MKTTTDSGLCACICRGLLLALAAFAFVPCGAAETANDGAERRRIDEERAAAERSFDAASARCASRFLVTACVDQARGERREVMQRLDHELSVLDAQARRRRAAQRLQRIEEKQRAAASRPAVDRRPPAPKAAVRAVRPAEGTASAAVSPKPSDAASAAARPRPHAREAWDRRQREAEAHRQAVQRRHAERAARRKPAAPLPPGD